MLLFYIPVCSFTFLFLYHFTYCLRLQPSNPAELLLIWANGKSGVVHFSIPAMVIYIIAHDTFKEGSSRRVVDPTMHFTAIALLSNASRSYSDTPRSRDIRKPTDYRLAYSRPPTEYSDASESPYKKLLAAFIQSDRRRPSCFRLPSAYLVQFSTKARQPVALLTDAGVKSVVFSSTCVPLIEAGSTAPVRSNVIRPIGPIRPIRPISCNTRFHLLFPSVDVFLD